jgi:acyl-coenzyme A synthetase/AMP-(fatty) acid ligase
LQRSHRCAHHNAVRNAHNLENAFAAQLGKALAPKEVLFVGDIPKTRNAKVMRRIVRAEYLGENLATPLRWKTRRRWMKSSAQRHGQALW